MLDIQLLRTDLDAVARRLADRGFEFPVAAFQALEAQRKTCQTATQDLQAKRNALSKQIGQLKARGEDTSAVMAEVAGLGDALERNERELETVRQSLDDLLAGIPNVPRADVPAGRSADDNVEVRRVGSPRLFDFPVRDHVDIGEGLGLLDFATAAKISGARFSLMKGPMARLHRAIAQFTHSLSLDARHTKTLLNLGIVRAFGKQDLAGAQQAWEQVVAIAPSSPEAQAAQKGRDGLKAAHAQAPGQGAS